MKLDHISPSQLGTFGNCGMQWKYRYMDGLRLAPGFAQIRGKSTHQGVEVNFSQKIESKEDLSVEEVKAITSDAVDQQLEGPVTKDGDYEEMTLEQAGGIIKDEAVALAGLHTEELAPTIQPRAVEMRIELPETEEIPAIVGIMDLIDDEEQIHDTKTAKKSPPATTADTSDQLSFYDLLYRTAYGPPPKGMQLDYLIRTPGKKLKAIVLPTQVRPDSELVTLLDRVKVMKAAVEKEVFLPAPAGAWLCSKRWCGYHIDNGGPCPFSRGQARPQT